MDLIISIVTYNNSKIISETLESILANTFDISYQIVIHDNNSSDNTLEIIRAIKSDVIHIIDSKTNYGFGQGHNQVAKSFDAKYLLVLNPDIRIKNNIFKELYDFMEKNQDIGMTTPKIVSQNGCMQYLCKQNPTIVDLFLRRFVPSSISAFFKSRLEWYEMRSTGYKRVFLIPYATGCFMFFRFPIFREIDGFDESFFMYLEDADITRRVNKISTCKFYPFNVVEHLWERGSHKSWKLTWINIQSAYYYFNKWGWKFW